MPSEAPLSQTQELPGDNKMTADDMISKLGDLTLENAGGKNKETLVKDLERMDSHYMMKKKELQGKILELEKTFKPTFDTILEKRKLLIQANDDSVPGFWMEVFNNVNDEWQIIEEHDEPVFRHLMDVTYEYLSVDKKSFKVVFHWEENEFFENKTLTVTFRAEPMNQWTEDLDVIKIECDEIKWKPEKNVIMETVQVKKKKGRKGKATTSTVQRKRASVFRWFFRSLEPDVELSDKDEDSDDEDYSDESDEEDEDPTGMRMHEMYDVAQDIKDSVIPHAIRYFTGEACEDPEDGDDEGDSDDSDDDCPDLAKDGAKQEECKQQ